MQTFYRLVAAFVYPFLAILAVVVIVQFLADHTAQQACDHSGKVAGEVDR